MKPVVDGRNARWAEHRRTRRSELVDATIVAVRRHGAGVGMDEVAAAAATSKTVVYRHFADKGELYVAVCQRVADRLVGQLRAAMADENDPHVLLAAAIDAYLELIESDPELYRFVVHRPLLDRPVDADPVAGLSSMVGDHVAALIAARLRAEGRDSSAAAAWGHGLVGLVRAAADHWLDQADRIPRAELAAHLTTLTWSGLAGLLDPDTRHPTTERS